MSGDPTMGGFYLAEPVSEEEDATFQACMRVAFPHAADRRLTHEERLAQLAGPIADEEDALFEAHMKRFPRPA